METWILKLPQTDLPDQPILINVSRKAGGQKLDLDLLATDGESAYRTKVRQRKVDKLRDADYDGSTEEWESYLLYAFVSRTKHPLPPVLQDNLEVTCRISGKVPKQRLLITLQISVEGINSKRGSVELSYDENTDDVDLFGWAIKIADDRGALQQDLAESNKRSATAQSTITSLQNQLRELMKTKEEHEAQMLSKFTLLLNEKKLRIRTQQRQIAEQDQPAKSSSRHKSTSSSRKRKHVNVETHPDPDSESDGFEAMQVDSRVDDTVDQDQISDSEQDQMTETASESVSVSDVPLRDRKLTDVEPQKGHNTAFPKTATPRSPSEQASNAPDEKSSNNDDETASEDDEL